MNEIHDFQYNWFIMYLTIFKKLVLLQIYLFVRLHNFE